MFIVSRIERLLMEYKNFGKSQFEQFYFKHIKSTYLQNPNLDEEYAYLSELALKKYRDTDGGSDWNNLYLSLRKLANKAHLMYGNDKIIKGILKIL